MARRPDAVPEWMTWLAEVPEDARLTVATVIRNADFTSIDGLLVMEQEIMAHIAEGNLIPSVAGELRSWSELVYAQLCTLHHKPEKADSGNVLLQAFIQEASMNVNQPPPQTAYMRNPDVVDADPRGKALDVDTIPGVGSRKGARSANG